MTTAIVIAVLVTLMIASIVAGGLWLGAIKRKAWEAQFSPAWATWFTQTMPWFAWKAGSPASQGIALHDATDTLINFGPWSETAVRSVLINLHLVVHVAPSWTDRFGQKVAGLADCSLTYPVVSIGSDYAALAHELVEVMLQELPGVPGISVKPLPDNWWEKTDWGARILGEYEKRRQASKEKS